MTVKPIPEGYPRVTPYLYVDDAAGAIAFYHDVFGAVERMRMPSPGGRIGHAELLLGDAVVMLADEHPEMGVRSPKAYGGSGMSIMLYVDDVDAAVARAVERGAKVRRPVEDKFYGDRSGQIEDPYGHVWDVSTHVEDVSPEEMTTRMGAMPG
ncbi:VOC family protein [Streptacidiphilus sp. EB129]|uniref:VOC family protein n=1 Tax=Streptacidiphilus sp. EB129 TaxID=3156262 RepID=UPI003512D58E